MFLVGLQSKLLHEVLSIHVDALADLVDHIHAATFSPLPLSLALLECCFGLVDLGLGYYLAASLPERLHLLAQRRHVLLELSDLTFDLAVS